ncbi:hypothetical protein N7493_010636 [Penicillium malachiteum]|uniref:Tyrosinase copper-binding domain-containing protein n=1 Tax=Penicillium malachiteum TaxID=1324776 RepID=A0AAD6HD37_9EURO|nr:hypothetical protein N7493_010636 [Penicillium malachiteum]
MMLTWILTFTTLLILTQCWELPKTSGSQGNDKENSSIWASEFAQLESLTQFALKATQNNIGDHQAGCTLETLKIRRNWRQFSSAEKKDYIRSVLCLQALPSRTPPELAPGAKTRYDDFVATHMNQTETIHRSGFFLAWHRYFTHEFELSLRNECGYTGDFPYWDWGADADSMENSPVFDGSDTSLSGNGAFIPKQKGVRVPIGNYTPVFLPPGTGGGCVTSGPFVNYTVNMGPSYLSIPGGDIVFRRFPLDHNPRCMTRDLTTPALRSFANYTSILHLILHSQDILNFETSIQGRPESGSIGLHGGGHYAMGGDPGNDADGSPGDPGFWHHHGMIDRVWWIWQSLDLTNRQYAVAGTETYLNQPASPDVTLQTTVNVGYVNGNRSIAMKDIMSTTAGPFCYAYV